MPRQYLAIKFREWDDRTYTYHNDGPPVAVGDTVEVPTKKSKAAVKVLSLPTEVPPYETKSIILPDAQASLFEEPKP